METHGKGKPYNRVDAVMSKISIQNFKEKFSKTFPVFCHHIVPSWYLSNVKLELQKPLASRRSTLFVTTDFAENVLIVRKRELADQYFHRIEILLFGAVVSYVKTEGTEDPLLHQASYMVTSDYRTKDCQTVYCALRKCLIEALEAARRAGVVIRLVVHKVNLQSNWMLLMLLISMTMQEQGSKKLWLPCYCPVMLLLKHEATRLPCSDCN